MLRDYLNSNEDSLFGTLYGARLSLIKIPLEKNDGGQLWLTLTNDVAKLLEEQETYTYSMIGVTFLTVVVIFLIVFFFQRSLLSGLGSAIYVLKELTEGNKEVEIRRNKSFLGSQEDEVGQLVSALTAYKDKLKELLLNLS